jgi:hypothetical protein
MTKSFCRFHFSNMRHEENFCFLIVLEIIDNMEYYFQPKITEE